MKPKDIIAKEADKADILILAEEVLDGLEARGFVIVPVKMTPYMRKILNSDETWAALIEAARRPDELQ